MTAHTPPPNLTDTARCLRCGYQLRGLPENRCPECGRAFDPANWRTMRVANPNVIRPLTDADRAFLAAQYWPAKWLPWTLLVLLLLLTQYAGDIWPPFYCWSVLCGLALIPRERRGRLRRRVVRECGLDSDVLNTHNAIDRRLRRWALAAFVLILLRAPFLLNMAISGPALDRLADRLYSHDPWIENPPPRMVGLLFVHGIEVVPGHIAFLTVWPLAESAYSPTDIYPANSDEIIWYQPDVHGDGSVVYQRHLPDYYIPLPLWSCLFPQLNK